MQRFIVTTEGTDRLGLRELCERAVNELWIPDHLTQDQAAAFALDHFKRAVTSELQMLEVRSADG